MNITLISPADGLRFSVLDDLYREFIRMFELKNGSEDRGVMPEFGHRDGLDYDCTYPKSVIFRWRSDDPLARTLLEISDDETFAAPSLVTIHTVRQAADGEGEYFAEGTNFRVGHKYFWRVTSGDAVSEARSFETYPDKIRPVEISGIYNVRDVGGRMTDSGRRIKQGLLYRGTQFEHMPEDKSELNDHGRLIILRDLGIKTELDLRGDDDMDENPVVPELRVYRFLGGSYYETFPECDYREALRGTVRVLLDESNYPIYMHCAAGADRTGTVAYYLESILGVPVDDIMLGYKITGLSLHDYEMDGWYKKRDVEKHLGLLWGKYGKDVPFRELMKLDLMDLGFTEDDFDKLRRIFLEDAENKG